MRLEGLIAPLTAAALAWVAMPAIAGAANPTGPADDPAAMERAHDAQSREALAASIPARERKLATRERSDVVAEVAERARQLGLPGTMMPGCSPTCSTSGPCCSSTSTAARSARKPTVRPPAARSAASSAVS